MALSMERLQKDIAALRAEIKSYRQEQAELAANFGYYWVSETRKALCIIQAVHGTKADIVALGNHCSGEVETLSQREMRHPDPDWPKIGKWEPIVKPPAIVDLLDSTEEEAHERKPATVSRA